MLLIIKYNLYQLKYNPNIRNNIDTKIKHNELAFKRLPMLLLSFEHFIHIEYTKPATDIIEDIMYARETISKFKYKKYIKIEEHKFIKANTTDKVSTTKPFVLEFSISLSSSTISSYK